MGQVDRAATFRGNVVSGGVSLTKNGFPQLILQLCADEIYDADEDVWVDWSDTEFREQTSYLTLYGSKGETFHAAQIKKVFGWSGTSFRELDGIDFSAVKVQFRVESRVYNEKTKLEVNWIDEYDAVPGKSIKKLEDAELRQLDAKFSQFLTKAAPAKAPAKAPNEPKATPGVIKTKGKKVATSTERDVMCSDETVPTPAAPRSISMSNPNGSSIEGEESKGGIAGDRRSSIIFATVLPAIPPIPAPPAPPTAVKVEASIVGKCTKQEAWDTAVDLRKPSVTDQQLAELWYASIYEVAQTKEQDKLTDEQWWLVKEKVLNQISIF